MALPSVARNTYWAALLWLSISTVPLFANEHDLVGSLALAATPEAAQLLQLSTATHDQLTALIAARMLGGQKLLADDSLTAEEKHRRVATWAQESEQLGQKLFTLKQRETLIQLLLARDGMTSLVRPDVRNVIQLTDAQQRDIRALLVARQHAVDEATPLQMQIAIGKYERKLQSLLTAEQLQKWEQMAGLSEAPQPINKAVAATRVGNQPQTANTPDELRLLFAFERTPWRDVIDWLAKEAKLSLYVGTMPTGSLTYSDDRRHTLDETIERINRFLLPEGYTLLRSGRMISVIGLQDGRRDQLLESLAEYTDLSELDRRGDGEVVKCIFSIAKADPKEALEEIRGLVKLSTPLLMPKSKQLLVIETAAKLRLVRDTLDAMEAPTADAGPVRRFELEHVAGEDVLVALRPLVGITDKTSNVGEKINLAVAADGKQLLATGASDKLAIVEGAIGMLDQPATEKDAGNARVLRTHPVAGGNLQAADDVLQTLLEGEDVRLAQEPKTGQLIVLATADVQRRVEETIAELAGEATVFEVIQLQKVEPFVAMSVLREMLDIPYFSDDEDEAEDHPRLDWDTPSMRIFVRGTQSQVDEVTRIIERLERPKEETKNSTLRLLPIQGQKAEQLLETGKRFWPGNDDVLIFPPSAESPADVIEREINAPATQPSTAPPTTQKQRTARMQFVKTEKADDPTISGLPGPIKAQVTPRGILLHSQDVQLLNRFEEHLRTIAGPSALSEMRMAIFYLKHVRVGEAKSLLGDIRRGGSSRDRSYDEADTEESLGPPRPGRSMYSFAEPSIIADARLNRLIVQGTAAEILDIEKHLMIIDRDKSIADVQFRGKAHIIQLVNLPAAKAAAMVRDAYADELTAKANANQQQQQAQQQAQLLQLQQQQKQQQQQPSRPQGRNAPNQQPNQAPNQQPKPNEGENQRRQQTPTPPPAATNKGQQTQTQEPRMALAVDETNNALIVRAPDPLYQEVLALVQLVDDNAAQTTAVIPIRRANAAYIQQLLQGTLKPPAQRTEKPAAPQPAALNQLQLQLK